MQTGEAGISVLISARENEGLTRDASCFRSLSQQSAWKGIFNERKKRFALQKKNKNKTNTYLSLQSH